MMDKWQDLSFEDSDIPSLVQDVTSTDTKKRHYGVIGLRRLLGASDDPPIQQVLDIGVLPTLFQLAKNPSEPTVQLEATWCLANICSGTEEQVQEVIDKGGVESFLETLKPSNEEIVEQGLWGIANIAGSSLDQRDILIESGVIEPIVNILLKAKSLAVKKNGTWVLSNLYRSPVPPDAELGVTIPLLCSYLKKEEDLDILGNVAWALSYISTTEEEEERVESILSHDVSSRIVNLIESSSPKVYAPGLRIVGNIISCSDELAAIVLKEKNLLPSLLKLLDNELNGIRKETLWVLSNIAAGLPAQFESVMGNSVFIEKIIEAARSDSIGIKTEAVYILSNSTDTCTPAQIIRLLNNGVYNCLIELLDSDNEKILLGVLEGISNCLKWGKEFKLNNENGENKFAKQLRNSGGSEKLESLQNHPSDQVYQAVAQIIENYFEYDV